MKNLIASSVFLFVLTASSLSARGDIRHEIKITLKPQKHLIQVEDTIILPEEAPSNQKGEWHFLLHKGLTPQSPSPGIRIIKNEGFPKSTQFGLTPEAFTLDPKIPVASYIITLPEGERSFILTYAGEVFDAPQQEGALSPRSFELSSGIVSEEGIFLEGQSFWYPWFNNDLVTFSLDVSLPAGWDVVSQGKRGRHERGGDGTQVRWESAKPQQEIFLVGGKFTEYSRSAVNVKAMAFLRTPDPALAEKYLTVTGQYLEMYQKLLGPYPYKKFVLVENFWDTGYGMPSFTLLGPKIIRFPFILHSSYPHEILHNWWGNGVYVDYLSGNWSEGLTAYLADHLIQEQRGRGKKFRRAVLQKYTNYVTDEKDFPLTAFRQRHSSITEAVGYGKTAMFFHMLRQQMGDQAFVRSLQSFYKKKRFKRASFSDIEMVFSSVSKIDLKNEFDQWVNRTGAPALRIGSAKTEPETEGYRLTATIEQTQPGPAYKLRVPLAIQLEGEKTPYQTVVPMNEKAYLLELDLPARPVRLEVDPEFDLFRRLDRNEIPPALSLAFGAQKMMMVLPADAKEETAKGYLQLAESWQKSQEGEIEIQWDDKIEALPTDRAVWLFGWENRFLKRLESGLNEYDSLMTASGVRVEQKALRREDHSVVITTRHPDNPVVALTWVATNEVAAIPGLARKLPHYGPYSYLGFKGAEPTNVVKGSWPIIRSPMSVAVTQGDGKQAHTSIGKLAPRQALAALPPVFSEERMMADVRMLADEKMRGRGFGMPELDQAADYIATQFQQAGLKPLGGLPGSYFQVWEAFGGSPKKSATLKNIVGMIPGSNPKFEGESVVVGAHYDHLGLGWPDVHKGDEGKIHPGADDNASGVAVLLELARTLEKKWIPERTVIFVAFSGEELNVIGSRHYLKKIQSRFPMEKIIGMLNMDTVGRLEGKQVTIFGAASSTQWPHIFRGIGFVTGIPIKTVNKDFNASDQLSFHAAGVPAVQLFSGGHRDFHRPSDTIDKIDTAGMVKVAQVMKEAIEYLATRPDPLTVTLEARTVTSRPPDSSPRRVGLGTLPDFAYEGKGVRIDAVSPGSPAEKVGLRAGDIIVQVGKSAIDDLRSFSDVLKTLQAGEKISVTYLRGDKTLTVKTTVAER